VSCFFLFSFFFFGLLCGLGSMGWAQVESVGFFFVLLSVFLFLYFFYIFIVTGAGGLGPSPTTTPIFGLFLGGVLFWWGGW